MDLLLERDAELRVLAEAVEAAGRGRGSVAVVVGEAGIGKTTLVRALLDQLDATVHVLQGACDDLLTPRTLGPLRDAARGAGGPLADALADGGREALLEALLATLDDPLRPTVLVVEDVHWADDATIDVLRFVARRITQLRGLLVLTYRDDEVDAGHPLQSVLGVLAGPGVHRVQVHRLSQVAVSRLADASGVDALELAAVTGGNPFYVTEILAAPSAGVPPTVVDAVLARTRTLSPEAQQACEQLAVFPGSVPVELVARVLDDPVQGVAEAEARGVLEVRPDRVAFRHELARRAIEASLPVMRRVALHRRALDALLADDAPDADRVVHHAVEAGDLDQVLVHGPVAARAAQSVRSHRQALAHLERLVTHLDRFPEEEQAALLEAHALELHLLGAGNEPVASQQRAVAIRRRLGDAEALGHSLIWASRMHWAAADKAAAEAAALEAEEVLGAAGQPSASLALAMSTRSQLAMLAHEHEDALGHGRRAMAMATAVGDDEVLAHATLNVGSALAWGGDADRGLEVLREGLRLARSVGDDAQASRAHVNMAWHHTDRQEFARALQVIDEGERFAEAREQLAFAHYLRGVRARVLFMQGRLEEAERTCRAILAGAPGSGRVWLLSVRLVLGRVLVRRGSGEGPTWVDAARADATTARELQRSGAVAAATGELAWLRGETAAPGLDEAYALAVDRDFTPLVLELGYWRWRLGAQVRLPGRHPWALQVAGDWEAAAAGWAELGCPYEQALALLESDVPDRIVDAVRLLDDLGAEPAAAMARRRLRDLGVRSVPRGPRAETRSNVAGLTPRQVEVVDLVAEGLTNAQIAERLVLSVRTVDHHVSAVLQKLGVAGRDEAVAALAALDDAHPGGTPPANGSR